MDEELGNETYIDVVVSSALSPPIFTLIGNDDFFTNLMRIIWCFDFSWIYRRDRVGETKYIIFYTLFFCAVLFQGHGDAMSPDQHA